MALNKTILMGNLTRDPEVRQSQTGTFVVKFGLAVNEKVPDGQGGSKDEASFFDVVFFGKRGEALSRFFSKGRSIIVEGKLRQSRWQDKETGQNRSKIEIIGDNWEFTGQPRDESGQQGGGGYGAPSGGGYGSPPAGGYGGSSPAPSQGGYQQGSMQPGGYGNGQQQGGQQQGGQPNNGGAPDFPSHEDFSQQQGGQQQGGQQRGGQQQGGGFPDDVPF